MRVVVPFDAVRPKTRLAPVLDADERAGFARAMLGDVLAALRATGADPEVLATAPPDPPVDAPVTVDERPLTDAVNGVLAGTLGDRGGGADPPLERTDGGGADAAAVVMADLALATPAAVERLLATEGGVVLAPGRGGGTNALVARHPGFRVDYHGVSVRDHRRIAREAGADPVTVDSYRLSTDVDEPGDLPEVLLHGDGRSRRWLRERGFRLAVTDGRVGVERV